MQINGVGGNQVRDSYQKTNQMPNTAANKKETDEANKRLEALGVKVELSSQQKPVQEKVRTQTVKENTPVQEEPFSLIELLKNLWDEAKKLFRALWYSDDAQADESGIKVREISSKPQGPEVEDGSVRVTAGKDNAVQADAVAGEQAAGTTRAEITVGEPEIGAAQTEVVTAERKTDGGQADITAGESGAASVQPRSISGEQVARLAQSEIAEESAAALNPAELAAASMAVAPPQIAEKATENIALEDAGGQQDNFWEKLKVKFREIFGQLMSDTPQMDSGVQSQTAFQSQEEQAKEEMPKENEGGFELPELEGRPLHTSHLQDSYNKYGQYSKLAQDPQSSMSIRK